MDNLLIPNKIIRVKRRSIALVINKYGEFIVRAPLRAKDSEIMAFINEKSAWIIKKRTEMLNSILKNKLDLSDKAIFTIFDHEFTINLVDRKTAKISGETLYLPKHNTKETLVNLLKRELRRYLLVRVFEIAKSCSFEFKSISITSAKTNWGSCGARNSLNFTYKLAMCPKYVVDYIIVHELCHTKVKNHSINFWREVKKIYPEYKQCEEWLKQNRAIVNKI